MCIIYIYVKFNSMYVFVSLLEKGYAIRCSCLKQTIYHLPMFIHKRSQHTFPISIQFFHDMCDSYPLHD